MKKILLLIMLIGVFPQISATPIKDIHFNDINFQDCIASHKREPIHVSLPNVSKKDTDEFDFIVCDGDDIHDLEGLQYFTKVTRFELINNHEKVINLSKLATLNNLSSLSLTYTLLDDTSSLVGINHLVSLTLSHNQIHDISSLPFMPNLKNLRLDNNQINDISPLSQMAMLENLHLNHNQVSDFSALLDLLKLKELYLGHNNITTIPTGLNFLPLIRLEIQHNQISDISTLSDLTTLLYIDLSYNQISDISALTGKTELAWLLMDHNKIVDISPLSQSSQLHYVDLDNNQIKDISAFSGFNQIAHLHLDNNQITDISPLYNMLALEVLNLEHNNISDISVTANLGQIETIRLTGNNIKDFSPIPIPARLRLDIREMPITCTALEGLKAGGATDILTDKCEGNQNQAFIESPQINGIESGIGMIRGWSCDADKIQVEIDDRVDNFEDNERLTVAYGMSRKDTMSICGDDNNGFGIAMNWNTFGDGLHYVKILIDNQQYAKIPVYITTLETDFLRNAPTTPFILKDFPVPDRDSNVVWSESHQNFMLMSDYTITQEGKQGTGRHFNWLDTPQHKSFQSGIGLIHGWYCHNAPIWIVIDGIHHFDVINGSTRGDSPCRDKNSGFSVTVNWNSFGEGVHQLSAFAGFNNNSDSHEFANVTFIVTPLGLETDFLQGVNASYQLNGFPDQDSAVTISWSTDRQNFVLSDVIRQD